MNGTFERYAALAARLGLAAIFVLSGWGKLAAPEGTAAFIAGHGLPAPLALALAAGVTELAGGLALALGLRTRWAALALTALLVPVTFLFHNPAGLEAAAAHLQQIQLLKNVAIAGGLLAVAGCGAGPLALDALFARRARAHPASALREHAALS